ncbi:sensor histidine kinase [Dehalococcoidia bacterium]|nr:sensor histidine kinase [Dehalococcoidia bacterium]
MSHQEHRPWSRWQGHIAFVPSAYRLLAFAIAASKILLFPPIYHPIIPSLALVTGVGIYSLVKALHPLRWHQAGIPGYSLLGADIAVCIFLVMVSGGLCSPFLLYTLAPVLTAALLLDGKVTFGVAGLSVTYVAGSHLVNPLLATRLFLPELSYFLIYMIAVCLTAALPYLINVNLRQRLQSQDILRERQRLSGEIHDGTTQTLSALRWQVQLLRRRLAEKGIDLDEARQLEALAERAHHDTRQSLELLRNYTGNGSFLSHLTDCLKHLSQDADIDFHLDIETDELHLEAVVELELLRVCQEAVTNIRKHSRAHNVWGKVRAVDNRLKVTIADDGCGFDGLAFYRDGAEAEGHGLAVMRERAESVGGRLRVLSMPGQGAEIQVEMPATNRHRSRFPWLK